MITIFIFDERIRELIIRTESEKTNEVDCKNKTEIHSEGVTNFTQTEKILNIKRHTLIDFLLEEGILYKNETNKPIAFEKYVKEGLFENKIFKARNGYVGIQSRVTPKGRTFISNLLKR